VPELPEVETMVRGIQSLVEGRTLVTFRKCRCACKPLSVQPALSTIRRRIVGRRVAQVSRLAKRIVMRFEHGESLVIEPRMTGLMLLADPPNREHLRFEWQFAIGKARESLYFWDRRGLGTVRLYREHEFTAELGPARLGPDALEMTLPQWRERCAKTGRPIKVALLDQKLTAGIGNLYASEILHLARIHPAQLANDLKPKQLQRLHAATQEVLNAAIDHEGSTLSDGTYRNAVSRNGQYQNEHRVYARAEELCPTCGKVPIKRTVQAQRSTFFCPACQRLK
jgi:formamidopyrimidine-DNA glycosylase